MSSLSRVSRPLESFKGKECDADAEYEVQMIVAERTKKARKQVRPEDFRV